MRERIFSNSTQMGSYLEAWYYTWNNVTAYSFLQPYTASIKRRKMHDVVVPDFRRRQKNGEVFINPCLLIDEEISNTPFTFSGKDYYGSDPSKVEYVKSGVDLLNRLPAFVSYWDSAFIDVYYNLINDSDVDLAVAKAWSNVDVSEAAALASLGELPETIAWIASIYQRGLNLVRTFRNKKLLLRKLTSIKPKDLYDALSNLYLEFRYAFRPLVFEMKQAIEAAKAKIAKGTRQTARGFDGGRNTSSTSNVYDWVGHCHLVVDTTETTTRNIRAGVLFDIESDINGIASLWGFDKPLETVWELTPFSFILDWFFNIGNVISAWTPDPSLRILGSWVTIEELYTVQHKTAEITCYDSSWFGFRVEGPTVLGAGQLSANRLTKMRFVSPSRPILPSLKINLDLAKITDLTLIGQKLLASFRRA